VPAALARAVAAAYGVLKATVKAGANELEIIQAQDELVSPTQLFRVEQVA